MPTFEPRLELLSLTLKSILIHMGPHDELNLHDDASSNIEEIFRLCDELATQFSITNINVYAHNTNIGLVPNLNRALQNVASEFFAIFGQDDIAKYQDMDYCDQLIDNNPNTDLFLFRTEFIDVNGTIILDDNIHHESDNYLKCTPSVLELALGWGKLTNSIRYSIHGALFRTGTVVFDETFRIEDHPIFLNKASQKKLILSSCQSSQYRRHSGQMTSRNWSYFLDDLLICSRYLPFHKWVIVAIKKLAQRFKRWFFTL